LKILSHPTKPERRSRLRFPLDTDLRFQVIRRGQGKPLFGVGHAANMSSKGLAFRTDTPLDTGTRLAVSIAWPAMLDDHCRLRLTIEGTVLRTDGSLVVMEVETHDFRTSGRSTTAAPGRSSLVAQQVEAFLPSRRG